MGARIFAYYFIGSFATACLLLLAIAVGSGDGRTYVVTSDVSGPESKYQFGQHLRVLYQPEHPDGARIDAFAPLWTLPLVAGIIGSAFSVVPAIVITGWRRRRLAAESQVLGTCMGVMLAASGVQVGRWVTPGSRTHWALGALVVNSMAIIFGWVALFGQASGFSGGVGNGGAAAGMGGGVPVARIAFGAFSAFASAASLWSWKQVLRRKM